jgi:hypothetical protein
MPAIVGGGGKEKVSGEVVVKNLRKCPKSPQISKANIFIEPLHLKK